jgi:uncharacterized protein involved in outer membrane biogenesis
MPALLKSRLVWALAVPLLLVSLYALLGFKVAPNLVRDQAIGFVRENYGRQLTVGAVAIHPFKLQAEVRDLALPDADGQPMLGFERLFVDFEVASLWNRAFTFSEVTIEAPLLRAVLRQDGALNLGDLVLPEDPEAADEPLPALWIHRLAVDRGSVEFNNQLRARPVTRYFRDVGFGLDDFRTTPEGGEFSLSAGSPEEETFDWKGRFALEPIVTSQGEFRFGALQAVGIGEFLGDDLPFALTRGLVNLAGTYRLALGEQTELDLELPAIELADLALRARGVDADWVTIPKLLVAGTRVALPAQTVTVDKVSLDALQAEAWMSADGSINLEQLFAPTAPERPATPASTNSADSAATSPASPTAAPSGPPVTASSTASGELDWTVTVSGVELTNAAIAFEDRAAEPVKKFDLAPVNLRISDVSLDLSQPLPVNLDAMINGHARFEAAGTLTPEPLAAELDIRLAKARMQILQPYVLPLADLTITGGELDVAGKVTLAPPERDEPEINFTGEASITRFSSVDNALKEDLVNFEQVQLQKLAYSMAPDALSIDRVLVRRPYARVIVSQEQIVNLAAVLDPAGTQAALAERRAAAAAEAARSPAERKRLEREQKAADRAAAKARKGGKAPPPPIPTAVADAPETFPIRIREVRIEDGRMNFSDYFVEPDFSADVQALGGTITGVSSATDSRARVQLAGKLDEFSPVSIEGELQPFAFDRHTDLQMAFENIPLPIFNPYSGPVAGYNIAKGKLTTRLHYRIEDRKLDAQHNIRIDQLEWGEASATQGEATLPVKLATSLLKDRDGVIKLDVPVGGTLDDPTFRVGPIIWQVIKNLIVKAVTAPFALLGSLFAGAEEAQFVDFAPGEAVLDPATAARLDALAKSLAERPELKLDVPIGAVPDLDRPALVERAYETALVGAVASRKTKGAESGAVAGEFASLEPTQRIEVLTALVRQQTGTEPVLPEPPAPPEDTSREDAKALRQAAALEYLEQAARAGVVVPDVEFDRLAEQRAGAIEQALLGGGVLEPTRVFKVREGKVSSQDGKVRFELGLE